MGRSEADELAADRKQGHLSEHEHKAVCAELQGDLMILVYSLIKIHNYDSEGISINDMRLC